MSRPLESRYGSAQLADVAKVALAMIGTAAVLLVYEWATDRSVVGPLVAMMVPPALALAALELRALLLWLRR